MTEEKEIRVYKSGPSNLLVDRTKPMVKFTGHITEDLETKKYWKKKVKSQFIK